MGYNDANQPRRWEQLAVKMTKENDHAKLTQLTNELLMELDRESEGRYGHSAKPANN